VREMDRHRIRETSGLIPADVRSVLDVGCGDGIFANYLLESLPQLTSVHATDWSEAALMHVKTKKTKASIDSLPFADREFDLVSCLEVIEHLQVRTYQPGLSEICRVSKRYVLLSVPNSEPLRHSQVECPHCKTRWNPSHHLRSFTPKSLARLLTEFGFRSSCQVLVGRQRDYLLPSRYRDYRRRVVGVRGTGVLCPLCGYGDDTGNRCASHAERPSSTLRRLVKLLWPKRTRSPWIVVLYERQPHGE